jgi:hypothetical protein
MNGAGKGRRTFAYVSIGTEFSYCLVIDGRPHVGANSFATHFASSALHMPCAACGHVNAPVAEEMASGLAIADAFARRTGRGRGRRGLGRRERRRRQRYRHCEFCGGSARVVNRPRREHARSRDNRAGGLGLAGGPYQLIVSARARICADACRSLPIRPVALGKKCRRDRRRPRRLPAVDYGNARSSLTQV